MFFSESTSTASSSPFPNASYFTPSRPPRLVPTRIPRLLTGYSPCTRPLAILTPPDSSKSRDPILAAKLRRKLHEISPRPPESIVPRSILAFHSKELNDALESVCKAFSNSKVPKETKIETPPRTLVMHANPFHLPSQMSFHEEPTPYARKEFFNLDTKVEKYNYKRKKPLRRPFRVDKLNMFLKRWRIGWSRDITLPQMSPRVEFTGVEDEEEAIEISWAPKEQDEPSVAEISSESSTSSSWERIHEDDMTGLEEDEGDHSRKYDAETLETLEQILEELEFIGPEMDNDLLEDVEAMLNEMSEVNRLMRPHSYSEIVTLQERVSRDEGETNLEGIRRAYYRGRIDSQAEHDWSFDEENDCFGLAG
ncbi:hypothetical protein TWF694_002871 [Orbilia ellipsospora]|uniref:Uncharacterized protein n=1 Tax=Orbilia ellipsospora TaxID=2528407 RepID=A0AAV9X1A8_9PEZI